MSDPALTIRARFPRADRDPYQRAARNALLKLLFAAENVRTALGSVEEATGFFLMDLPTSLAFHAPRAQLERLAERLTGLARECSHAAGTLAGLEPYVSQFDPRSEANDEQRGEAVRGVVGGHRDGREGVPF